MKQRPLVLSYSCKLRAFFSHRLLLALGIPVVSWGGPLILSDNFNAPDNANFDQSDQTGRRQGLWADQVQLRSSRIQHGIVNNELNFLRHPTGGSGRIRFHDANNLSAWWDFAQGEVGQQILEDGGLRISFEWTPPNNNLSDWMSWSVGFPDQGTLGEPDVRLNHAETDFGILFRTNGGTQYFDNSAAAVGGDYDVTEVVKRHVIIDLSFTSFDDGSDVIARAEVDGQEVLSDFAFQWENNGGMLFMEWGNYVHGSKADNIRISTLAPDGLVVLLNGSNIATPSFYSSVVAGDLIATLSATLNDAPETGTFALVGGEGDTDNAKFRITGNRLEGNGTDLTGLDHGVNLSIRVRGTGASPTNTADQIFILTVIADTDSDLLPDIWELAKAENLTDLNGRGTGSGPGAGSGNYDGDSLTDIQEYVISTTTYPNINPMASDTDGDGLEDGAEIAGADGRPPTDPTLADTDRDGLDDKVETGTGTFVSSTNTGTDPTLADTDNDYYQDDFEVERGSNPHDDTSLPTQASNISIVGISTDESTGISADKVYTHTVSGGYEASVNDVVFTKLGPSATPPDFDWQTSADKAEIATLNNGDWLPDNGGVFDAGLPQLLGGFTYSGQGAAGGNYQTFTLYGLTSGQAYELRLYARLWDTEGPGRSIDFYFINGEEQTRAMVPMDRPVWIPPLTGDHEAWYIGFSYVAQEDSLVLRAQVPSGGVATSGSFHLYGLSNEETDAVIVPTSSIQVTAVTYQPTPSPSLALTFTSQQGVNYVIEVSSNLLPSGNTGGWSLLATTPGASGTTTTYIDSTPGVATSATRYYRITEQAR